MTRMRSEIPPSAFAKAETAAAVISDKLRDVYLRLEELERRAWLEELEPVVIEIRTPDSRTATWWNSGRGIPVSTRGTPTQVVLLRLEALAGTGVTSTAIPGLIEWQHREGGILLMYVPALTTNTTYRLTLGALYAP
jgi:hypothetical protein